MKKVILIVALLFPIGVFIFLRFFGKNEFSIPIYYESGMVDIPSKCNQSYTTPYHVSDTTLLKFGWKSGVVLIAKDTNAQSTLAKLDEDLRAQIQILFLVEQSDYLEEFLTCDLLLRKPSTTVLLDDQRRIRGYYDLQTREEFDRLEVELKILLKKY